MVLKTRSINPLETIYEEAGSFTASSVDIPDQLSSSIRPTESIDGLISARSIPSVNIQRRRVHDKPPIEVQFRDGSKRFINPLTTLSMMINRKQLLDNPSKKFPSRKVSTSQYRPLSHPDLNKKKSQSKLPLVITIITMEDLLQAGITPPVSSSTDESETSTPTHSESNSSMKRLIDIRQVPFKQSPVIYDKSHALQNSDHREPTVSESLSILPKPSVSTLQVTLTGRKNESHLPFNSTFPKISSNLPIRATQSSSSALVGSGLNSAFRPFFKPLRIIPQIPLTVDKMSSYNSFSQQQQPHLQALSPSNRKHVALSLLPKPNNVTIDPRRSQTTSNPLTESSRLLPNLQYFNITSNSIFDIPQLSNRYMNIPLRITLPAVMPGHNQQLVCKQNNALERRLLNAGLSPETITLYERVLDVSKSRQMTFLAPPIYSLTSII